MVPVPIVVVSGLVSPIPTEVGWLVVVSTVEVPDTVVDPWVDVVTSVPVVVFSVDGFGVVLELTVVVPICTIQ